MNLCFQFLITWFEFMRIHFLLQQSGLEWLAHTETKTILQWGRWAWRAGKTHICKGEFVSVRCECEEGSIKVGEFWVLMGPPDLSLPWPVVGGGEFICSTSWNNNNKNKLWVKCEWEEIEGWNCHTVTKFEWPRRRKYDKKIFVGVIF